MKADLRLVPLAGGLWAGAGVGVGVRPALAVGVGLAALAGAVVVLWVASRVRQGAVVSVAVALLLAGLGAAGVAAGAAVSSRQAGPIGALIDDGATGVVEATVRAPPRPVRTQRAFGQERWVVKVRIEKMASRGVAGTAHTPALVVGGPQWAGLVVGERIQVRARLSAADPGDDVAAIVRPLGDPVVIAAAGPVASAAQLVRERLRLACSVLPEGPAGLLPGLVVGDTSALPADLEADMRTTGLTHLTAVSGTNITIVVGAVLGVLSVLGVRRWVRFVGAAVALVGFVVLVGPEPSVLRAGVMGVVGLVALLVARPGAGLPPLCVAVGLLVVADPWLSRAAGFGLSVAATAGLLILGPPLADVLARVLPRWVALALAVPVAAQLAVGPLLVVLDPRIPVYSVVANLLVEPAVAPVTVLGVAAAAVSVVSVPVAQVLVWVAGWPLRWVGGVAGFLAGLPGASVPWPSGVAGAGLLAVISLGAGLGAWAAVRRWDNSREDRGEVGPGARAVRTPRSGVRGGRVRRLVAGVAAVLVIVVVQVWLPGGWSGWPTTGWRVVACDVGQGSAVVVWAGQGSAVVIDTGPDPVAIDQCLSRLGVVEIGVLVLTHFHADHVDGLPGVVSGRTVREVLVTGLREPPEQADQALTELAGVGVPAHQAVPFETGQVGQVRYQVLAPLESLTHGSDSGSGPNNASVVTWLWVDGVTVAALGDIEDQAQQSLERTLAAHPQLAPVDVVLVAHHGSAVQFPALYERLAAPVALIGVGAGNSYGHPAPSALRLVGRTSTRVLRTDECGDAMVLDQDPGPAVQLATRCRH
ncbi:MAG: ComEC/Rec2 family competence protein [Actinomycetales bacterium]